MKAKLRSTAITEANGALEKFLNDFPDEATRRKFLNDELDVEIWKKFSTNDDWVRKNVDLLDKLTKKNDLAFTQKVSDFYKTSHQLPNKTFVPPDVYEGVQYNKYGFPEFNGTQVATPIDKVTINMKGNYSTDFTEAKTELLRILKQTDPDAQILSNPLRLKYQGQISEQLTWHHMENGQHR